MTISTQLTLLRVVLAGVVVVFLFQTGWIAKAVALLAFVIASVTDWLDGWLARRLKQESDLGALLDPIADKVLVLGTLLALARIGLFPLWMAIVILVRDVLVTATRLIAVKRSVVLPAAREGKHKTVWQMAALIGGLSLLVLRELPAGFDPSLDAWLASAVLASLWIALIFTVVSGVSFFWRQRRLFER